jgi:sigma-B regulation protein RsbU (phosphoserine phosphatase)
MSHFDESQRINRVVFEYAAKIGRQQQFDLLLNDLADMGRDLTVSERCSIWLVDARTGELWTTVAHGVDEIRIPQGQGLVGACIEGRETILANDAEHDPRLFSQVGKSTGYVTRSVLVVPLLASDGTVMGAFQALNKEGGYSAGDRDLLGLAASYAARAIENQRLRHEAERARMLYREMEIARDVQQQLFPKSLPAVPGLECAAECRPAKFVGGDYYDFIAMPGDTLGFSIGDVAGKGISAALMMASIQAGLRSQFVRRPDSLSSMMNDFNRVVYASSPGDKYSTLFCAIYDPGERLLHYVNAGGSPPMLRRERQGEVSIERPSGGGLPVGLLPMARYEEATLRMEPGDALVCFSDGISEAMNPSGEPWDEDQLAKVIEGLGGLKAAEITQRVVAAADAFAAGADQSDDMTVAVLRAV